MSSTERDSDDNNTKINPAQSVYFTEPGTTNDEITIEFDDKRKLFVSKNFLQYASPVFEAMFKHDFEERRNNHVKLSGKKYEDFLELLLCIHPRTLHSVSEANVLQVVSIADEYQVTPIVTRCKEFMKAWILESVEKARKNGRFYLDHVDFLRQCLVFVAKAEDMNYDDVVTTGVRTIAKFGHPHVYYHKEFDKSEASGGEPSIGCKVNNETLGEITKQCMRLFDELPAEIRCRILSERINYVDDLKLK